MTTIRAGRSPARARVRAILLSTVLSAAIASAANALIALAGLAAGADPAAVGLTPPAYIAFTVVGVLAGSIGWALIRRAKSARRILAVLVPIVLVLSLAPVAALAVTSGNPATVTAAISLAIMHVVTVAVAVPIYRIFLPISDWTRDSGSKTWSLGQGA